MGTFYVLFSAAMWAFHGNIAGFLFDARGVSPTLLVAVRLLGTGLILSCYLLFREGKNPLALWGQRDQLLPLILYTFVGVSTMQLAFYQCIAASNAPTATLIQYMGLFLVIAFAAHREGQLPPLGTYLALALSVTGLILLVTGGDLGALKISPAALKWGLIAALGYASFNIGPLLLPRPFRALELVAASMLVAGISVALLGRPPLPPSWDARTLLAMAYSIFGGTLFPFLLYTVGQRMVGPQRAVILALSESVISALLSIFLFGIPLGPMDLMSMAMILAGILMVQLQGHGLRGRG